MESVGVKSKKRVKELGEVYTPDSIVQDMIGEVVKNLKDKGHTDEDIAKETFLEPTCGDGQFLVRLYDLKLKLIKDLNGYTDEELIRFFIRALSTVYGIDIDPENVEESKIRILQYIINGQVWTFDNDDEKFKVIKNPLFDKDWYKRAIYSNLRNVVINIVNNNIIVGNMLDTYNTHIVAYDWLEDNTEVQVYTVSLEDLQSGCEITSEVMPVRHADIEVVADSFDKYEYVNLDNYTDLTDKYEDMYKEYKVKSVQSAITKSKPTKKTNTFSLGGFK